MSQLGLDKRRGESIKAWAPTVTAPGSPRTMRNEKLNILSKRIFGKLILDKNMSGNGYR